MSSSDEETILELPLGPPPILQDIREELKEYIECPENLPIHQLENLQLYWPGTSNTLGLLEFDLAPLATTLKFDRDPITGRIGQMREVGLPGAGEHAKNSMSMSRAPGPPMEGVQGNSSNFPFWPGGFDEPQAPKATGTVNVDFENDLRTVAKGFFDGVEFERDHCTPTACSAEQIALGLTNAVKKTRRNSQTKEINLMAIIHEEESMLDLWSEKVPDKEEPPKKQPIDPPNVDDLDVLNFEDCSIPVLKITEKPQSKSKHAEWAEQLDVSTPVINFDKKVPKPAITFDYELDTFQKQAIIKLEEGCNVFVAAHTSAGKTAVAEYAIALSQRHLTRVIYTSPIKALSNQKYRDFKRNKHFESVGLITGDIQINQTANCLIMTTEILQTMLYNASEILRDLEYVIFDEVHYINDENRGHVWEEIVILLPPNVNIVMLSATVPNPLIFANWVGNIKKKKMYVISTLKRPVPLQHYLYGGIDKKTKNDIFLILDDNGHFKLDNWYKLKSVKDLKSNGNCQGGVPQFKGTRRPYMSPKQEKTMWEAFAAYLKENDKLPVVVFTLSKNRCDSNADALAAVDLTTNSEKAHVRRFFKKCIQRLNECDRELPQIKRMSTLLGRGIGVHHSGILPILKEIIELLFQNGVVKLLFATETFAMGINMPARTVVFDTIRKFDGKHFRELLPTEYIQMAGRAGRRGHDEVGTVILMCKAEVPSMSELKPMMCGQPQNLQSQFKITYSMVLNLRRVIESVSIEDMMRRSFKELSFTTDRKKREEELKEIEETLANMPPETDIENQLSKFYKMSIEYISEWEYMSTQIFTAKKIHKALTPGRVIIISYKHHYKKLAAFLTANQKRDNTEYVVLVLNNQSKEQVEMPEDWYKIIALTKKNLFVPDGVPSYEYLVVECQNILEVTNVSIIADPAMILADYTKKQIQRFRNDPPNQNCQMAIQELASLSLSAFIRPSVLQPYVLATLPQHPEVVKRSQYFNKLHTKLHESPVIEMENFEKHFLEVFTRNEMLRRKHDLQFILSDESMALYPDYVSRVEVLKTLGYINKDDRITLKGRVALDMGIHELLLTELIYRNVLTNLQPAEIAALMSALVFKGKLDNKETPCNIDLPVLSENYKIIEDVRTDIETIERSCGVDPVEPLSSGLIQVVYEWARAESFAKIMELTDVQEGIIVRCIQQLNDILQDIKTAAHRIGETVLKEKMEEASAAIKRDIVFTASLYTQD